MKQIWLRPFMFVKKKSDFDGLISDFPSQTHPLFSHSSQKCNIVIPKITKIEKNSSRKQLIRPQKHYIKIRKDLNLPGINIYELDEIDINFYVDSILKVGKISAELFVKMMVELDKQYYQYNLCRKQALRKIYNQNDNHVQLQERHEIMNRVFEYWKYKRFKLQSPSIRMSCLNSEGPFKERQKGRMVLRNRGYKAGAKIMFYKIKEEMYALRKIFGRILNRQECTVKQCKVKREFLQQNFINLLKYIRDKKNEKYMRTVERTEQDRVNRVNKIQRNLYRKSPTQSSLQILNKLISRQYQYLYPPPDYVSYCSQLISLYYIHNNIGEQADDDFDTKYLIDKFKK